MSRRPGTGRPAMQSHSSGRPLVTSARALRGARRRNSTLAVGVARGIRQDTPRECGRDLRLDLLSALGNRRRVR